MNYQRKLLGRRWVNDNVTTAELYLPGETAKLAFENRGKRRASPLRYHLICPRKRLEPVVRTYFISAAVLLSSTARAAMA